MSNSVLPSSAKYQKTQQKVMSPHTATSNLVTATNSNNGNNNAANNKRVKVTLACIVCRKKKVKCDGIQPRCSRCHSMGFSCQYSDPPKKRGPPKGQVEIIESRAHRIESLRVGSVSQNNHKTTSVTNVASGHGDLDYSMMNEVTTNGNNTKLFSPEYNTILHLISGAVDALQTSKWPSSPKPLDLQDTPGSHYIKNDFFMKDDLMINNYQKWTSCYFGYFNVFFPVLSQPHFIRQISQQQADPLLLYAVCAIGSKYSDNGEESTHILFERCQNILNVSNSPTTLSTVQALVILCWHAYLLGNMQLCCDLRHRLNRATNELQLHRDPRSSLGIVSIEMHRRAFWVIFVTDQWLSCCTGVRCLVRQHSWDCQWPQLEDSQLLVIDSKQWKPTASNISSASHQHANDSPLDYSHHMPDLTTEYALQITAFSEMIKLSYIVYDIYDLHASYSSAISQQQQATVNHLTNWLLRLPPYLEYGKPTDDSPPSPIARIYHMLYYTVQIMIHQSFVRQWNAMPPSSVSLSSESAPIITTSSLSNPRNLADINMSRSICTNAANTIIHIAEQMIQYKQQMYLHNTFMTSLTLAASVHLNNSLNSEQKHGISSLLNLKKSFGILKNCNCSLLQHIELGQLLDRYLLDHCGIQLYEKTKEQHQQASTRRPSSSVKRNAHSVKLENDIADYPRKRRSQHQMNSTAPQLLSSTTPIIEQQSSLAMTSPTSLEGWDNSKDDLLDTRLHSLLHDTHPYSSTSYTMASPPRTSTSSSPSSSALSLSSINCESVGNSLDTAWLNETTSILNLFPDTSALAISTNTSITSPTSQCHPYCSSTQLHPIAIQQSLYSPPTSNSATQSPTLSSDSNPHVVVTPMAETAYYTGGECDIDYFKLSSGGSSYPSSDNLSLYDFMNECSLIPPYTH